MLGSTSAEPHCILSYEGIKLGSSEEDGINHCTCAPTLSQHACTHAHTHTLLHFFDVIVSWHIQRLPSLLRHTLLDIWDCSIHSFHAICYKYTHCSIPDLVDCHHHVF